MCTIIAYLRDSLTYMRQVAIHMMEYVDAATSNILSPDIIPLEDLMNMLRHIELELPTTMYLHISLYNTLHFYQYLNTHVLIAGQLLLLTDVPIQKRAQQLQIYEVFNLPVLYNNLSTQYKINLMYIGIIDDKTKAAAITAQQYIACQHENRQFCKINAPFQSLMNASSCITALYAKNNQAIGEQCSLSNIPCVTYIHTCCGNFKPPDNFLKPQDTRINNNDNFFDKAASAVPLQQEF